MKRGAEALSVLFLVMVCMPGSAVSSQCTIKEVRAPTLMEPQSAPPISFNLTVGKVTIVEVTKDRLELALTVGLIATRDATVSRITIANLRLNDMPLYAAPVTETMRFTAGRRVNLTHPLLITVYYRDLDTLRPLQVLLAENRVRAEGTLYFDLELSLLEKVALFARRARVSLNFLQQVPLELPGGTTMRAAALQMVTATAAAIERIGAGVESGLALASSWRLNLWRDYAPALLIGHVRFSLDDKRGGLQEVECTGNGFRISSDKFILQKSLLEPWKFDPEIAAAMQRDRLAIDKDSYDLWVWPIDARLRSPADLPDTSTPFRLSQQAIRVLVRPRDESETILVSRAQGRPQKIKTLRREGATNLVLLEFAHPSGRTKLSQVKLATDENKLSWDQLAIFRFTAGIEAQLPRPDLILLPATRDGSKIRLGTPVDSSAWGAPLISPEGVVGIVQDENKGLSLAEAFRAVKYEKNATNGIKFEFVSVPAGEFIMGSEEGEKDERPVHKVRISKPFELGKYEVTQEQWLAITGVNPSHFKGANHPVENVSWEDVQQFIGALNQREDGYLYRLPTEAEWEYSCRAGTTDASGGTIKDMGWLKNNSGRETHPVRKKRPNAWGIYDMYGNVWEWCHDWQDKDYYANSPASDPEGPSSGLKRVIRGGGLTTAAENCRSSLRNGASPETRISDIGFRLVRQVR